MEILLRISEVGASTQYGKSKLTASPVDTLLYPIDLDDKQYRTNEDGAKILTIEGVKHIIKELQLVLVSAEREDF